MIALAAGCASTPPPVVIAGRTVPPIIKKIPVAEIPAELLIECYDEPAKEVSAKEAARLAELRRKSIAECNAVKAKYRGGK